MTKLWLLKGKRTAPGWRNLERDAKAEAIDVVIFDPLAWAIIEAEEEPGGYEGLEPSPPVDGLYLNPTGVPLYLVSGTRVDDPREVIKALGTEAEALLAKIGDPDVVLDRLGRAF